MTAPISIYIDGLGYTTFTQESLSITSIEGQTISTMQGTVYDKGNAITIPPEGKDILITRVDTGERIFGGLVSMVTGYTEQGAKTGRYWDLLCQSYTVLLDRTIFYAAYGPAFTYTNDNSQALTGDVAILGHLFEKSVVGEWGNTGSKSEIKIDPTYVQQGTKDLTSLTFQYSYAREAVELLCNYVSHNYYVDFNLNLHKYLRETEVAPFSLSDSFNGTTSLRYRNLKWKRDATRLVNNFVVFGATANSSVQDSYASNDGIATVISVNFRGSAIPLYAPPGYSQIRVWTNIGTLATDSETSLGWVLNTVGIYNKDSLTDYDCLYDSNALTLTFNSAPPSFTHAVKVEYVFPYGCGMPYFNSASYTKYGRVFSNKLVSADANSAVAMIGKINNENLQFSSALEILTCSVSDADFPAGNTSRFKAGQWVSVTNSGLEISARSYQIHEMTTKILGGQVMEYFLEMRNWTLE